MSACCETNKKKRSRVEALLDGELDGELDDVDDKVRLQVYYYYYSC